MDADFIAYWPSGWMEKRLQPRLAGVMDIVLEHIIGSTWSPLYLMRKESEPWRILAATVRSTSR